MYVALRETMDVYPDGTKLTRRVGEEIETFLTWPQRNQIAALNQRMVRFIPDGQMLSGAEIQSAQRPSELQRAKAATLDAHASAQEPEGLSTHRCEDCDYESPSARGLAIHRGAAHKKR